MDVLKEKSNVMNQEFQGFQSSLKALLNQMIESVTTTDETSTYEVNIQRLLVDYSFKMNKIENTYLQRCESSLNNSSNNDTKPIKRSSFCRFQIADGHPLKSSPTVLNDDNDSFDLYHSSQTQKNSVNAQTSQIPQCSHCGQTFNRDCDLYGHIRSQHNLPPFACDVAGCGATFHWNRDFRQHQATHRHNTNTATHRTSSTFTNTTRAMWKCIECDIHYEHQSSLKRHNREKHGNVSGSDINYHPNKRRRISTISVPQSGSQESQPRHQCNICFKVFSSGSALGGHKSAAHRNGKGVTNQEEYRCDRCFRCFTTMHGLNGHRGHCPMNPNNRHNTMGNDGVFKCDHCGCHFNRKDGLYSHLRDQHDIAPFVCNIDGCSTAFRYYRQWQKHQKTEHWTPQTGHRSISDDEDELEMFECSICGKLLSDQKKLRNHELLHSAERPHKCHLCESAFVLKERLRNHLLHTHKVKPYQCEWCNEGFTKQKDLAAHHAKCPLCSGKLQSDIERNEQSAQSKEQQGVVDADRETVVNRDVLCTENVGFGSGRSILNHRL